MPAITGFTDAPISSSNDDTLEIKHYLESLGAFILKCETPLTISIQGEWGTGKTSAMYIIKEVMERENVPTVWFNTWQFSQFSMQDYLPVSLLNSLVDALGNPKEVKCALEKVWAACAGAGKVAAKGVSMFAMEKVVGGALTGMVFGPEKENAVVEHSPLTLADDIMRLKENLAIGVRNRLESCKSSRLVVFIDDLDRLEPRRAVELLEVLKNFLDVSGCVFVLAVDHSVVEQGIKAKFGLERIDRKGRSFFDKIIQLSFNLPVAQYNTQKYVRGLIEQIGVTLDRGQDDVSRYVKLISTSVGFNPRGMKRIFNLFQLLGTVAENTAVLDSVNSITESRKQQLLFGLLCMQTSFPELYAHLALKRDSIEGELLEMLASNNRDETYPVSPLVDPEIEPEDRIEEMCEFMRVFNSVLDLDGNNIISPNEMACLKSLLAFSAITSSGGPARPTNTRRREKLASFTDLRSILRDRGLERELALSIYEVLDRGIEEYSRLHQKRYTRNITANAVVTYNVERGDFAGSRGRRAVVFLYTYAQAGGVAAHIGQTPKRSLHSVTDITEQFIQEIFEHYEMISSEAS